MTKEYKTMTQEQLEDELYEALEANDDTRQIIQALHHLPNLHKYYPNKFQTLIRSTTNENARDEPIYEDFISRVEFINRTGIFVTPGYFSFIYENFKDSGATVDEFLLDYEENYSVCIERVKLKGVFKYEMMDEVLCGAADYDEDTEPTIWEIINGLAKEHDFECKRNKEAGLEEDRSDESKWEIGNEEDVDDIVV